MSNPVNLPMPDVNALAHSNKLLQLIKQAIGRQEGVLSFAEFMELALYAPGLGYYSAGAQKFGEAGDFVTAPEISPLFSRCIARQCQEVLERSGGGAILELGAGTGVMAAAILIELEQRQSLPDHYFILEISADLKQRQQRYLQKTIPQLYERILWLSTLPQQPLKGVILANEIADALPVRRFMLEEGQPWELGVGLKDDRLIWQKMKITQDDFLQAVNALRGAVLRNVDNYISEINLALPLWLRSLSACLQKGLILLIDYGFPAKEYYHPSRNAGTLMCHYRHYAHTDPFWLPGLQDITAHVDFTSVATAACAAGLSVEGYGTQAAFLLSCGLLELAQEDFSLPDNLRQQLSVSRQVQKLTAVHEMGELFKVIALTKDFSEKLCGFTLQNAVPRLLVDE